MFSHRTWAEVMFALPFSRIWLLIIWLLKMFVIVVWEALFRIIINNSRSLGSDWQEKFKLQLATLYIKVFIQMYTYMKSKTDSRCLYCSYFVSNYKPFTFLKFVFTTLTQRIQACLKLELPQQSYLSIPFKHFFIQIYT